MNDASCAAGTYVGVGSYVEGQVTVDLTGASLRDGARSFEFEMTLR